MKLFVTFLLFCLPLGSARSDDTSLAIEAVKNVFSECKKCVFFALPAKSELIFDHKIYFVSTLDRLPPPFWSVATSKKGKAYVLDVKNLAPWNQMAQADRIRLKSDAEYVQFAKMFLDLAVGRSIYIEGLTQGEKMEIRKITKKLPIEKTRIVRDKKRARLQFYAKDVTGGLQFWDLIVEPTGTVAKAVSRSF